MKWSKVKGAGGYEIYRSTSKKGNYKKIATVKKAGTTSYKDKSVKSGKTYYYKVRPFKMTGSNGGFLCGTEGQTAEQTRCESQKTIVQDKYKLETN